MSNLTPYYIEIKSIEFITNQTISFVLSNITSQLGVKIEVSIM